MSQNDDLKSTWENLRRDADKGREPQLIAARLGQRQLSFRALVERIESEFIAEYAESPLLKEAGTTAERLKLLRSVVDYRLAVESVYLSADDKAAIISTAYSGLFGYGPLDALFLDERVTTISLEGADKASVRYGHGELESIGPIFDDEGHLRRILRRLLLDAGADLYDDQPFIETGLVINGCAVGITLITPMMSFGYNADIRVHPARLPTWDELVSADFLTDKAVALLTAIARSSQGFVVVGDVESGKTMLLSMLAQLLPDPQGAIAVERAGELRLPDGVRRLTARWPSGDEPGITFGEQISVALSQQPTCIILDEVRSDEPAMIAPLLRDDPVPRQIWSFRGPFDVKRLRNALSMLARRADMSQTEVMVEALYRRLPFVITVWRAHGRLALYSVGEWQYRGLEYPDFALLMHRRDGQIQITGERPAQVLDLPVSFWDV